jgi:hypothetical protein
MTAPVWADALRRELVQAAVRRQRRRRLPLRAALAAAAVAVSASALASGPTTALAEVRVDETGGRVVVTLLEIEQDPHRVEASLRAAGFDVAVEPVATGPSAVGRFVGTYDSGPLPTELVRIDGSPHAFLAFSLPAGWDGALRLYVGRPAEPDEAYRAFTDALAPEEVLGCLPLLGRPAAQAADAVAGRAAHVDFRRSDQPSSPPLAAAELRAAPFAGWVVLRADAVAPGQVVVWLGPPGSHPPPGGPHTCDP